MCASHSSEENTGGRLLSLLGIRATVNQLTHKVEELGSRYARIGVFSSRFHPISLVIAYSLRQMRMLRHLQVYADSHVLGIGPVAYCGTY